MIKQGYREVFQGMQTDFSEKIRSAAARIESIASVIGTGDHTHVTSCAESVLNCMKSAMYPGSFGCKNNCGKSTAEKIETAMSILSSSMGMMGLGESVIRNALVSLAEALPVIKEMLETDIKAAYIGDPAAQSYDEIILAYPAFEAIFTYRIAHNLYMSDVPVLPRVMTETAHRKTGIDIHPGATIGSYFFIDHGTGVVIGETTTIGDNVKLYQGVTLGAKSFEADENGNPIKHIKRHPDIGNNVTIYARATILGGNTKIGDNCTIGGNVWLTESVEKNSTVLISRDRAYDIINRK